MTPASLCLFADAAPLRTFEFGRIQSNGDWWMYAGILLAILAPLLWIYRRDTRELPWLLRVGLPLLRTLVLVGLLIIYLQPRMRSERKEHLDSRVLLLADTSLSMAITDVDTPGGRAGLTRLQQVAAGLDKSDFIDRLRKKHDVTVVPFNSVLEKDRRIVLPTTAPPPQLAAPEPNMFWLFLEGPWPIPLVGLAAEAVLVVVLFRTRRRAVLAAMGGVALLAISGVLIQRSMAGDTEKDSQAADSEASQASTPNPLEGQTGTRPAIAPPSWQKQLVPGGTDTRLGEALERLLREERSTPVSGVVVFSDFGQNAGVSPDAAMEIAHEARIPVYTVGIGSEKRPFDVGVADFNVPPRVFPNDRISVEGSIQGDGMKGRSVRVELLARDGAEAVDPSHRGQGRVVDSVEKILLGDGEAVPVKFELPPMELGRHALCLRVKAPAGSSKRMPKFREGAIEVSNHQTHVLLLAGGPMRDYQYLRTMLFRDKSVKVDVLLQSGQPGMSQEASSILTEFPATWQEMADYDCIVAFDPDWRELKPDQVGLLFKWVDEDHGGMIVVAGPVNAGRSEEGWVQDPEMAKIRRLYPVEFNQSVTAGSYKTYSSAEAWPLDFTREGLQASYLWLGDTAIESEAKWKEFSGVYSYCPVRGKKAGATVLARFSDPHLAQDGQLPIYMAVQRYSASPVLYLGSAETWRVRRVDPALFEQFWTKTIRFVAQEHLRRQSSRGSMAIDSEQYTVGSTVEVKAQLKNSSLGNLTAPNVMLFVTRDGVDRQQIAMPADPERPGRYQVDLPVLRPGEYNLELTVPESADERLHQTFMGVVPKLEDENPQRNVALAQDIARKTDGLYYDDLSAALSDSASPSLVDRLKDVSRTETIPLSPRPEEDEKWLKWALVALCCVLSLEWIVRRLAKLA
jgi:hypothetical protein